MIVVLEPPAAEPLALPDVYDHLRLGLGLTEHPDDARLRRLIKSAREQVETHTRRALIQQTLRWTIDSSASWHCTLPRPSLIAVTAVQYFDVDNALRSVDLADYRVVGVGARLGGYVDFVGGYSAPPVYARSDARSIVYEAGFMPGDTGDDDDAKLRANVPEPIRDAMLLLVDQAYNARLPAEDMVIDDRVASLLATYKVNLV